MKSDVLFVLMLIFIACNEPAEEAVVSTDQPIAHVPQPLQIISPKPDDEVMVLSSGNITLRELKADLNHSAQITLTTKQFKEGSNRFEFAVSGVEHYTLAYVANNFSLSRFSSSVFDVELMYGNNVFLAFLTDSNRISIKSNEGSVLQNVVIGGGEDLFEVDRPHLIYYLPEAETATPILDFYLVNTVIDKEGNRVKVTINGDVFTIEKWAAYQIEGLEPNKDHVLRIQLVDSAGNLIDGPFNDSGDRQFRIMPKMS